MLSDTITHISEMRARAAYLDSLRIMNCACMCDQDRQRSSDMVQPSPSSEKVPGSVPAGDGKTAGGGLTLRQSEFAHLAAVAIPSSLVAIEAET